MYKAMFELSADRAEFVSRLFSKPRPAGPQADDDGRGAVRGLRAVATSEALYRQNLARHRRRTSTSTHGFTLSADDLRAARVRSTSHSSGTAGTPLLDHACPAFGGGRGGAVGGAFPTYEELIAADRLGRRAAAIWRPRRTSGSLKTMEEKNLIVPVVGNFAGPKALRASRPLRPRARQRSSRRSTCRTSSSTCSRTASSTPSRRTSPRCRSTTRSTFIRSVSARFGYGGACHRARRPRHGARSDRRARRRLQGRQGQQLQRHQREIKALNS